MKRFLLSFVAVIAMTMTASAAKLYATFGTPGGNATYSAPTYTWTASTNNLMTVFEFANGELANYEKLTFTFSNLNNGPVRMGYYVGSTFTEFGNGFYNAGTKEIDLTALGIDLSTVTKISFGGRSNSGSVDILANDIYLENDEPDPFLYATFGTPGGNASYAAPTYTWTAGNNNLMTVFEFANGELANYEKLTFTFSNLIDGPVRMGYYVGSTFTEFGNGFYSTGTKEVDLTTLGIDLSTVTKISFGGRSNSGSVDILANDVFLTRSTTTTGISTVRTATASDNVVYNLDGQRVNNPTKGLFIVNGRKVAFK